MSASHLAEGLPDCRMRLLQAATDVFISEGYRAGVDRIATLAGVAKQTLYNHFPSKAELFGEVIRQATADLLVTLDDDGQDLRGRLLRFAVAYREKRLSPTGLGFYRALIAETARFPELAQTFYQTGPARTASRLSAVLDRAMQLGQLRRDDPEFLTTLFLSMLVGAELTQCLFSGAAAPAIDAARAERIVDGFLRACAP